MSVNRCPCGATLGTLTQTVLPGAGPEKCPACLTNDRARMMLAGLPTEGEREFDALSEWEQEFLPSVRRCFSERGTLTDRQYEVLERIWSRL